MGHVAEEARKYLQHNEIPQVFESLMTGLMYNKPEDPIDFMHRAIVKIRNEPDKRVTWDMFIDNPPPAVSLYSNGGAAGSPAGAAAPSERSQTPSSRPSSTMALAAKAQPPHVPVVLFMGGPGGGKTAHAEKAAAGLAEKGLVHVSVPKLIREGIGKYGGKHKEWKTAAKSYKAGQLIPNDLALALVKAEMGKHPQAKAFLLEGYPREMDQVKDFEREMRRVDLALILDYDEEALKEQMRQRGVAINVMEQRLYDFKTKTLPAAKHFDDKFLLHLIPGEQDESIIVEEMRKHIAGAMSGAPKNALPAGLKRSKFHAEASVEDLEAVPAGLPSPEANVVIVIGAPGSGKKMYCQRIAKKYEGFVHLSMGDILKAKIDENPSEPRWQKALERMTAGELVPTDMCRVLIHTAIHSHPQAWGFVLEGYPRTAEQARDFEGNVEKVDLVLLIDCTEAYCAENLRGRDEGIAEGAIAARLALFKHHTLPMLKYFDDSGKLRVVRAKPGKAKGQATFQHAFPDTQHLVEGDKGVDDIFAELTNVIDTVLFIPQDNGSGHSLESSKNGHH